MGGVLLHISSTDFPGNEYCRAQFFSHNYSNRSGGMILHPSLFLILPVKVILTGKILAFIRIVI
jgi:hypothetical protein